ncbi:MAG: hypothetical protein D6798_04940 [Deltaproteobacteria bacterium]|nr:MAG: hypothetical protein D6798_04940 [Deltaproteobacteria bacterium]
MSGILAWTLGGGAARAAQRLRFEVAVEPGLSLSSLSVEVDRLGVVEQRALSDDGSADGDVAGDGIWTAVVDGPYARVVGVRLAGALPGEAEVDLWEGQARTDDARAATTAWRVVRRDGKLVGERVAVALPAGSSALSEAAPLVVAMGWGLAVLIVLTMLGLWRRPTGVPG